MYLDIAERGHVLEVCADWPGAWCGNAGWAPLYPFIIRAISWICNCDHLTVAWILSRVFYLGFLLVIGNLLVTRSDLKSWILLLLAAFAPGTIYAQAIFPISLAMFLLALHIYFLFKQRYVWAGICTALLVWTYSTGFVFLGCSGMFFLVYRNENNFKKAVETGMKLLLPGILSLGGLFLYDHIVTGHWNALFLVQSKYGHTPQSTFKMMGMHWQKLISLKGGMFWVEVQHMLMLLLVPVFMVFVFLRKDLSRTHKFFFATWAFVFWFFPYSMSAQVSLYRSAALLAPLVVVLKPASLRYLIPLFTIWLGLWGASAAMFILSLIV